MGWGLLATATTALWRTFAVAGLLLAMPAAAEEQRRPDVIWTSNSDVPEQATISATDARVAGQMPHRVAAKMSYAQLVDEVKADFNTADYYQGAYLINQALNELCPAQIWQLRQSAAGYTLPA